MTKSRPAVSGVLGGRQHLGDRPGGKRKWLPPVGTGGGALGAPHPLTGEGRRDVRSPHPLRLAWTFG